jgi:hypothetical protein
MFTLQSSPTTANTIAVNEPSFTLNSVKVNASDGDLGHTYRQSSSSKPTIGHFLINELNLASLPELTPRKGKLYDHVRNKQSAFYKLKKKYKGKKLRKLCEVDSDPLSLESARFWQEFLGSVDSNLRVGGENLKTNFGYFSP